MGPVGGFPMIVVALASGVVALQAIFRDGERALTVFAALVWFLMAAALVVELLIALVLMLGVRRGEATSVQPNPLLARREA